MKAGLARAIGSASRLTGRGGGTTLPGRVLLRLDAHAIGRLAAGLSGPVTLISATNGKTTTAGMLGQVLSRAGRKPIHNRSGSNMTWGIATALAEQRGDEGLFEVDEAWLTKVAGETDPAVIVLGNLFRDQLDRYGELETLADAWADLVAARRRVTTFVLNADDPLIADLGGGEREGILYFGIDDPSVALAELQHAHDAKHCRHCGAPYTYEHAFVGHLGHYRCESCGNRRPQADVSGTQVTTMGMDGSEVELSTPSGPLSLTLPLPGVYNVYNALAAVTAGIALEIPLAEIKAGIESAGAVFGRVEVIDVAGTEVAILLIKNPAGANEVLRTLLAEQSRAPVDGLHLWSALNDRIADGRDVSWIWDADFEVIAPAIGHVTCAGTRAEDLALRLKYAGVPIKRISVNREIAGSLDEARAGSKGARLYALPTYTALIELRRLLARRGYAKEFWE
jgi:UDP-N-acetylmuramyl tripeptide synthase